MNRIPCAETSEQVLNKGLLSFASTLETLARNGNSDSVNYEACALTKLLAGMSTLNDVIKRLDL
jgi:hypothetical protein